MEVIQNINAGQLKWRLGEFQILFISMGQGDCCLITCPDGRHVMVDCGTKAGEEENHQMYHVATDLRSNDQLGSNLTYKNKLEALILTHPDIDHINKVHELLAAGKAGFSYNDIIEPQLKNGSKITRPTLKRGASEPITPNTRPPTFLDSIAVEKVFFSDSDRERFDFKSQPLQAYSNQSNDCSGIIYDKLKPTELACVAINARENDLHKWTTPYGQANYVRQDLSQEKCVVVCKGIHDNKDWSVKIIAGGVKKDTTVVDQGDNDGRNAGSLVTFIEYDADRILICGDATISTQMFLLKSTFKDKLGQGLSLIQVPHHGSDLTEFHNDLVEHCKPKQAVISVQKYEHSHHLPGKTSLERAEKYAEVVSNGYLVCYWEKKTQADLETEKTRWNTAGYEYKVEKDSQDRIARWVRQKAGKDFKEEGTVIIDGMNNTSVTKYFLQQKKTTKEVQQTSMQHHIFYYFDGSGT